MSNRNNLRAVARGALPLLLLLPAIANAQFDLSKVEFRTQQLAPNLYALFGGGGNLALLTGPEGAVLVDDEFAQLTPKVRAAIARVTDQPVRFVVNTHWHFDHTQGNESFGRTGSVIVAHANTRKRMSSRQLVDFFNVTQEPAPAVALPIVTFDRDITLHLNGETIEALHVANAHTDSDVLLFFRNANVMHTGDVYISGMYPFVDMGSGGSIDGVIAACGVLLAKSNPDTRIIPGHGRVATQAELRAWCDMLGVVRGRVAAQLARRRTLEQTLAAKPSAEFDAQYSGGAMKPDIWVQRLYSDLSRNAKR